MTPRNKTSKQVKKQEWPFITEELIMSQLDLDSV